jgi:hypothetical protein
MFVFLELNDSYLSQSGYDPADVPFRSIRTLNQTVSDAMLPDSDIKTKDLHEALDGDQPMQFHYVSILAQIKRMLGNPAYSGKMYTKFEYEEMR